MPMMTPVAVVGLSSFPKYDSCILIDKAGVQRCHLVSHRQLLCVPKFWVTLYAMRAVAARRLCACRAEVCDAEAEEDCPDSVTKTLAWAEAQSERGSGLHCNPVFADALHRSQQASNVLSPQACHHYLLYRA